MIKHFTVVLKNDDKFQSAVKVEDHTGKDHARVLSHSATASAEPLPSVLISSS